MVNMINDKLVKKIIPNAVKYSLLNKLENSGFSRLKELKPVDFGDLVQCPVEALERSNKIPVLVNTPIAYCRSLRGVNFTCDHESGHPFIQALRIYSSTLCYVSARKKLIQYYSSVQPRNVPELLGISDPSVFIKDLPAICYQYPWDNTPSIKLEKYRKKEIIQEASGHGAPMQYEGWHHFGPVSNNKIDLELIRLIKVFESIKKNGYNRSGNIDGDICGVCLSHKNTTRTIITKGHHRIAALSILGYKNVPIRYGVEETNVVNRSESNRWLSVINGIFSVDEANFVFDRIFKGIQPDVCKEYLAISDKLK